MELRIARFGMGVSWEELPPLGPFEIPANPDHAQELRTEWTPTEGGHRCVRGAIHLQGGQALGFGLNLHVIQSAAERSRWHIPFRVGNPEPQRQPLVLQVAGDPALVEARLIIGTRMVQPGEPILLNAGEEREAVLLLHARTEEALAAVTAVEAFLGGRFLDGIQVEVHRPAQVARHQPDRFEPEAVWEHEPAAAVVTR
jgi:hypothetical protein